MTDQTVPVPLDLLKALFDNTTITRDVYDGDSVAVSPGALDALIDIKGLIPNPPKIGDVIDTSEKAAQVLPGTVLRDSVGDIWLKKPDGEFTYTNPRVTNGPTWSNVVYPSYPTYKPTVIAVPV